LKRLDYFGDLWFEVDSPGKNDFYPFTGTQLKKHDPVGCQLMETTWGKPKNADNLKSSG
jgi:hypothetical protein